MTKVLEPAVDFANEALWAYFDKKRKTHSLVRGPLAQILLKYPQDYTLSGPYCWMKFEDVPTGRSERITAEDVMKSLDEIDYLIREGEKTWLA